MPSLMRSVGTVKDEEQLVIQAQQSANTIENIFLSVVVALLSLVLADLGDMGFREIIVSPPGGINGDPQGSLVLIVPFGG